MLNKRDDLPPEVLPAPRPAQSAARSANDGVPVKVEAVEAAVAVTAGQQEQQRLGEPKDPPDVGVITVQDNGADDKNSSKAEGAGGDSEPATNDGATAAGSSNDPGDILAAALRMASKCHTIGFPHHARRFDWMEEWAEKILEKDTEAEVVQCQAILEAIGGGLEQLPWCIQGGVRFPQEAHG